MARSAKMPEAGKRTNGWAGKRLPLIVRQRISASSLKGKDSPFWKGGITPLNEKIRQSVEYKNFSRNVRERDDYRCYDCGQRGGKVHVHHIFSFAEYPRLRFMTENGITLCIPCHKETTSYLNRWSGANQR